MSYKFVKVEKEQKVLTVTINRPEVLNAMHAPFHLEMEQIWDDFSSDPNLWVGIITGSGVKAFSTGNDLKYTAGGGQGYKNKSGAGGLTTRLNLEKPIIAAVNGYALGGGFEIALACDIILASKNAIFALPEVRVGLIAGAGGIQRLIRQVGRASALEMIYTGRHVKADEALRLGIVAKVVEQKELLKCAKKLAKQIIAVSPSSVKATKKVINSMDKDARLGESLAFTRDVVSTLKNTDDFKEGVNAFVEKRKPVWKNC